MSYWREVGAGVRESKGHTGSWLQAPGRMGIRHSNQENAFASKEKYFFLVNNMHPLIVLFMLCMLDKKRSFSVQVKNKELTQVGAVRRERGGEVRSAAGSHPASSTGLWPNPRGRGRRAGRSGRLASTRRPLDPSGCGGGRGQLRVVCRRRSAHHECWKPTGSVGS